MDILYLLMAALKFIGLLLLILILALLLVIIVILIVPIKYKLYIDKTDTIYICTNIKWLYSIVALDIIYDSDNKTKQFFTLFGKIIFPIKQKNMRRSKDNKVKPARKDKALGSSKEKKQVKPSKTYDTQNKAKNKGKPNKGKLKIKGIIKQIQGFQYKKELLADTIEWVAKIFRNILPSTLYIDIEIGREDPASTGQLIAVLSALYPFYYPIVNITGNYEKECLYGKLKVSGDIVLGRFLHDFIKYICTASVKQMIVVIRKDRKGKKDGRKVTN